MISGNLTAHDKCVPSWAVGLTADEFIEQVPVVAEMPTPLLILDGPALEANIAWMDSWTSERGLELMPHGKTTMAPQLWHQQLAGGSSGITVATPFQLRVAREARVEQVMLANQLVDTAVIRWLAQDIEAHGGRVWSWVDGPEGVELIESALAGTGLKLDVLVELGRPGGRTGARSVDLALSLADRVVLSPSVRLAGVAGYEGAIAKGRGAEALAAARAFVEDLVDVGERSLSSVETSDVVVTAGGSAFPDVVGEVFHAAAERGIEARYVLRSGAYVTHDEGFYQSISPFEEHGLRAAARGVCRVVSQPEEGLVLLDAGKRDLPYDEGLPRPLFALKKDGSRVELGGAAEVTSLNDQHTFVTLSAGVELTLGDHVVLGLSHPCTMFDKWQKIPVVSSVEDLGSATVTDLIQTYF